jgi:ABC transporter DrrB family efflux protein
VIFWVYGFPFILAVGLGIAFSGSEIEPPRVDIERVAGQEKKVEDLFQLLKQEKLRVEIHDEEECRQRRRTGKTALYVIPTSGGYEYVYDKTEQEGVVARHWVEAIQRRHKDPGAVAVIDVPLSEPGNRYIDFLVPGLIGLNLMGGGMWGIGFVLVDMRVRKLLKRFLATPMRRRDFLLAIMTARLVFMVPDVLLLLLVGWIGFGVPVRGDLGTLVVIILIGAAAFAGIGLLVACRAEKTETISGLMNLVMLPMWLLSGTFFSSARFPDATQPFIQALPLTQLNDALREVMLEGKTLADVGWRLAILMAWAVVSFVLALRWFRWR